MKTDKNNMYDSALSTWPVWKHNKGGVYTVVGHRRGLVFYVSHADGRKWYRPEDEFLDGRFEPIRDAFPLTAEEAGFERG